MLRCLVRAGVPASYLLIPAASYVLPEVRTEKRDSKVGVKGFSSTDTISASKGYNHLEILELCSLVYSQCEKHPQRVITVQLLKNITLN